MKRILVIQLKRIGDLILTTPALRKLRAAQPRAKITLMLDAASAGIAPVLDMVDEVIAFDRRKLNAGLWARAVRGGYDAALDFTGTDRSSVLMLLCRARRRIGFERNRKSGVRGLACGEWVKSSVRDLHTVDHLLDLVEPLAKEIRKPELWLKAPEKVQTAADRLLGEKGVTGQFAIIHAGTARAEKYWVAERWARMADALKESGFSVVLTGGRSPEEVEHLEHLVAASHAPLVNLAGKSDLVTLLALISRASLVMCVDSAAMHFAAAAGTPVIALFGPTNPHHWRPQAGISRIITAGPEMKVGEKFRKAPMENISVEMALAAVRELETGGLKS